MVRLTVLSNFFACPRLKLMKTCFIDIEAAKKAHLSGHGGTNDGIIGAAAAVGLTACGWSGRFIEFGKLRNLPGEVLVSELNNTGIEEER